MEEITLESDGVTDWPRLAGCLLDDPDLVALTASKRAVEKLPKSRVLHVPWLEKRKVYVMGREEAKEYVRDAGKIIQAVKKAYGQGTEALED